MENKEQNKTKGKKLITALLVLVIIVLGVVIYFLLHKPEEKAERNISEGLVVDGDLDEKASKARFTTDMNMIWTFPSGSAVSSNAQIGNSISNMYECYFEVYLDDEEQTLLYSSPVLPVGKRLDKLELNQVLPDGAYDALCTYHILDDEDPDKELGTVSFAVSLMVVKE
ncbi:hypothetical protein AALC75_08920 [Lachnospiraceae bacterium 48-42]